LSAKAAKEFIEKVKWASRRSPASLRGSLRQIGEFLTFKITGAVPLLPQNKKIRSLSLILPDNPIFIKKLSETILVQINRLHGFYGICEIGAT
jgi:hypothetical protein